MGVHAGSSTEIGKPGFESEIDKLKRDRSLLMQELVQLEQDHRGRAHQVEAMKQRMDEAEQRQKQMVSFLGKLLQNQDGLTRLQQVNEQKEIDSPRVKRKFVKHQQIGQSSLTSSMKAQIVKYKVESGISPLMQNLDSNGGKTECLIQDMVGKLGIGTQGHVGDFSTDDIVEELIEASDQVGEIGLGEGSMGYEDALFKGKHTACPCGELDADYFVSFPEDLAKEKTISYFMSPGVENIIKQEDMWNIGFDVSNGMDTSSFDVWDSLFDANAPEHAVTGGLSDLWDIGLQQTAEGLGVDKWQGGASSFDDFESQPE